MATKWVYLYLFFAVAHPITEIVDRTNLRRFLNRIYYGASRDDFPVTRLGGIVGSIAVLAILVIPAVLLLLLTYVPSVIPSGVQPFEGALWWLAFGLVLADVFQHAFHLAKHRDQIAPRVHLITILGVLVPLLAIVENRGSKSFLLCGGLLLIGALLIILNWKKNSRKALGKAFPSPLALPG